MGAGRMFALCTYRGSEKRGVLDRERNKAKHRHMMNVKMSALLSLVPWLILAHGIRFQPFTVGKP